jgi:hypothetical protein
LWFTTARRHFVEHPVVSHTENDNLAIGAPSAWELTKLSYRLSTYGNRITANAKTKEQETGHRGAGWAFGNVIVEVFNEQTQLDPYHEVAHVVARQLGNPPALLNEGFAVYLSERMGGDALEHLGSPGLRVNEVVHQNRMAGKYIPLVRLLTFTEIGTVDSRPEIAYAEAGSFVKFLVEEFGVENCENYTNPLRTATSGPSWKRTSVNSRRCTGSA